MKQPLQTKEEPNFVEFVDKIIAITSIANFGQQNQPGVSVYTDRTGFVRAAVYEKLERVIEELRAKDPIRPIVDLTLEEYAGTLKLTEGLNLDIPKAEPKEVEKSRRSV